MLVASQDVIVVTHNYRLGVLGFLAKLGAPLAGNYALFDQQLVIKWVKDNIAAFGGDSSSITLYGQSSGAFMVTYQMASSSNNASLFQRAIAQSGSGLTVKTVTVNPDPIANPLIAGVNCSDSDDLLACLRNTPMTQLLAATAAPTGSLLFTPVLDGDFLSADLPLQIAKFVSSGYTTNFTMNLGNFGDYDLMSGWNSLDGSAFIDILSIVHHALTSSADITPGVGATTLRAALLAIADPRSSQSSFLQIFLSVLENHCLNTAAESNLEGESDEMLRVKCFLQISGWFFF